MISLEIAVQTGTIQEGFREKAVHGPSLLGGGTEDQREGLKGGCLGFRL